MGDNVIEFFDDLGRKISQAGQSAVQKTKEMTDIVKLNSSIADEEKKIRNSYAEIGKLYVSLHGEEHEPDFDELMADVHEAEEKINDYRKQIGNIKGIVKCEKCGADVPANSSYCNSCGAAMPVTETPEASAQEVTPDAQAEETGESEE